jgi:hypothetical protein
MVLVLNTKETTMKKSSKNKPSEKSPIKKAKPSVVKSSAPNTDVVPSPKSHTKQGILINLLQGSKGATVDEMVQATGWQRHSVQGMMFGVLKKKLGLTITSEKQQRGRVYRIGGTGK